MEVTRPSLDRWFLSMAEVAAQRSTCLRAQVGCVLARGNRLLALGYNGVSSGQAHCDVAGCIIGPNGGCQANHAESNALQWAERIGVDVYGGTAFVTMQPCLDCAMELHAEGIVRVVYQRPYRKTDGLEWLVARGVVVDKLAD